nr:putative clathrin assembly protein [Quercus suber]
MGRLKKLRNFIDILKDKASLIKATLSITKCHASVNVAVLHATTHNPSPPSEKHLAAVLNFGNGSRLTACACIEFRCGNVGIVQLERICEAPDSLHVNSLVFEVMRIVSEDFMLVQSEIFVRVVELGNRMESMIYGTESTQFFNVLKRLEDCKERLNREDNDGFWDLIRQTKKKVLMVKEKREEMRLVVVTMGHRRVS